jgi:hypothetical protein
LNSIYLFINGGIVLLGILSFIFLVWKSRRIKKSISKPDAIKHYEKIRDKLTLREKKEERLDNVNIPRINLGNLIGGFIIIFVGTALLPTVANLVTAAQTVTNVTGASSKVLGLITLFYALAISTSIIVIAAQELRNVGFI